MSQVKVTTDPNENKKQTKIMNKVDVQLNHKKEDGVSLPMIQFFTIDQNTIFKRLFSLNKKPYSRTLLQDYVQTAFCRYLDSWSFCDSHMHVFSLYTRLCSGKVFCP